jgi:predicted ATPase/DNA-binding XRE family transcriptional regulator
MPVTDHSDFASLLRRYRRRGGLTQEELAERAGLSVASISLLERGVTHAPQKATVSLLSEALALTPDEAAHFFAQARQSRQGDRQGDGSEEPASSAAQAHSQPTHSGSLPIPLTALIGREREQATLLALLERATTRLLTLIGPAGVGKTRLELELAATLRRDGRDVAFVDLIPIREPERVLPAIAQALDIQASGGLPLRESLARALRDRPLILALDNFEQVLPAARAVLELLVACPRVKALVTSRSALNVRGEQCFPVAPLPLPDTTQLQSLDALCAVPAVTLFLERAQAVWPDFTLTSLADGALVADICAQLDGLPLAIELAAARIRHVGLRPLHDRLGQQTFLGMLAEGAQDLPNHQRTMRSAIAWSNDLLSDEEKRLFRWLGVFIGGANDDAVAAVIGASDETAPRQLTMLVDASLIQRVETAGMSRYSQLVTLRAYAQEQLRAESEWDEARRRHADYFVGLVDLTFPDQVDQPQAVMARLEIEYENIRASLAWAWETGETMRGLHMAAYLRRFWASHSQYLEGLEWLDRFITRAGTPTQPKDRATLAEAWTGVLMITHRLDQLVRARHAGETALALWREQGDKSQIAYSKMNLANTITALHDYERAKTLYEEALALHREVENRKDQIFPLMNLGGLYYEMGMPREALAYYEESLALSRAVGETDWARALTWNNIGEARLLLDEPARAIEVTEPNYHLFTREHDIYGAATCAFTLGRAYWRAGEDATGRAYLDEAERLFRNLGNPAMAARILYCRATFILFALQGRDVAGARADLMQALGDLSDQMRANEYIWWLVERAGTLARYQSDAALAARLHAAGVAHRDALTGPLEPVERELRAADLAWLQTALDEDSLACALDERRALSVAEAHAELVGMLTGETADR